MKAQLALVIALVAFGVADPGAQNFGRMPPGSYSRTCNNAAMVGSVLTAHCKDQNGVTILTRLYVGNCSGDISNVFGELVCGSRNLPRGTFNQTCNACTADGSSLQCSCRDTKGAQIKTTLDLGSCSWGGNITNKDGHLQCDEGR